MSNPVVTVIIPTYNRRRWIGECLDSIKAQTYKNLETLVIDDCSTDETVEWLRHTPDYDFVTVHVQPQNGGASVARNTGIKMARGELIVFIDSDDLLAPNHIEKAVAIFNAEENIGLFACDSTIIGTEGEVLHSGRTWHEIQSEIRNYPVRTGVRKLKDVFIFSNIFPGFTLPKRVFAQVGDFDQSIFPMDDYDLMLRVAGAGYGIYYCHEPLALRREHSGQCSGPTNSVDTCRKQILTLEAALKRNPELRKAGPEIRKRMAQAKLELAISRLKAGQRASGLGAILQAIGTHPSQLGQLIRLGNRKFHRLVAST
ncbi:MAG TPA: glycosyltransferase family 2 protein [Pyrinomonadaceae bacterium]|jgi:glycosyltransferase involved in cell wall biosynthesis